jgi:glycolate oxidase FAD binding subunit
MLEPGSVGELQEIVRTCDRVLPRGGGSKPALSTPGAGFTAVDMTRLAGVVEYEPGEFTFTAQAGTRVTEVQTLLRTHGQYLPFDPLLAGRGATLGGTVAAGAAGPGRYRYGGVRDFLLGVRFVDGQGELVRSGGKVVKNAAGFDISKLMTGSLGQLGLLVELSFKVFPEPPAYATLRIDCPSLTDALERLVRLYGSQLDLDALDLIPKPTGATLWVRLGGLAEALPARVARVQALAGGEPASAAEDTAAWQAARELAWVPAGWVLVKVPLTPARIPALEAALAGPVPASGAAAAWSIFAPTSILRHYSAGGQVAWVALPGAPGVLDGLLAGQGLAGLVLLGPPGQSRLGARIGEVFARRVKTALDPAGRFPEV